VRIHHRRRFNIVRISRVTRSHFIYSRRIRAEAAQVTPH
jgi:hypothetical protein